MITDKFREVIGIVYKTINVGGFDWAFIGSTNCALQGMELTPRDLDLVTRLEDLRRVPEIFRNYSPSKVEELKADPQDLAWSAKLAKHPAFNVHAFVSGIDVQILGGWDDDEYVSKLVAKRVTYIDFNGLKLPCFTLDAEAEAYEEIQRPQKAERIRQFLRNR